MTIEEVAKHLQVPEDTLRRYERGERPPCAQHLAQLAGLYRIPPDELVLPPR